VLIRFSFDANGEPRLSVEPTCENTLREFEAYERSKKTGKPVSQMNHLMDAIRYGLSYLDTMAPATSIIYTGMGDGTFRLPSFV
jgi:hypothetical protein